MKTRFGAERYIDAPAVLVYHCIADHRGRRRRSRNTTVTEPVPGHKLIETGSGIETTVTVEQTVDGAYVRFDTVIDEPGIQGILNRLFAARTFGPFYRDELRRLEAHARAHPLPFS